LLQTGAKLQDSTLGLRHPAKNSGDGIFAVLAKASTQRANAVNATNDTNQQGVTNGTHAPVAQDSIHAVLSKASTNAANSTNVTTQQAVRNGTNAPVAQASKKSVAVPVAPATVPLTSSDYAIAILAFSMTAAAAYALLWYTTLHPAALSPTVAPLVAEFLGTFALVFTVGCCSLAGTSTWNATAIAAILMAMIYATAPVSGGNLNPAVSLCLGLAGKQTWATVVSYCIVQVIAGVSASLSICLVISPITGGIGPVAPYSWWQAGLVEVIYTALLCFVVLNAVAKGNDGNRLFAFAIGFVIIAGGYPCGSISGASFNPAVSLGLELVSSDSLGWGFAWVVFECIGSIVAVALFFVVRPEERHDFQILGTSTSAFQPAKYVAEFLGTFVLVLTVGLNIVTKSGATAWSAAAALMCMIFSLGNVSGAHFNPAVSLAIVFSGRGICSGGLAFAYMIFQALGGVMAGLLYASFHYSGPAADNAFPLAAGENHTVLNASVCEMIFTTLLAFTVLAVATTRKPATSNVSASHEDDDQPVMHYVAFCIGACVMVGGTCLGEVSGGELNPAVCIGIAVSNWVFRLSTTTATVLDFKSILLSPFVLFITFQMLAGVLAAIAFRLVHAAQYNEHSYKAKHLSKFFAEFLGTFYLVITVGFCSLGGSPAWNPLAIALVLMVMVYGVGSVSGAHLNPAVSLTLGFSKKIDSAQMLSYWFVQISAGVSAGVCFCALMGSDVPVMPQSVRSPHSFTWVQAVFAEVIYTSMLCFVVTQCAVASGNNRPQQNQFYGLSIGFVIVAGGYAVGGISGACFNPAVALGLSVSSSFYTGTCALLRWGFVWSVFELLGSLFASILFRVLRPSDFNQADNVHWGKKCLSEFLGVFFLVMTVGLNVISKSPATALSAAAALMCMIYSLGDISGAHFNPAVTLAVVLGGRGKCSPSMGISYVCAHFLAAVMAGHLYAGFHMAGPNRDVSFPLEPARGYSFFTAGLLEMFFTGVLAYTVLAVATTAKPQIYNFGLTIASCVIAGGFAVGSISGGELNPAVSLGISFANLGHKGVGHQAPPINFVPFALWELCGGMIAAVIFRITHPDEYFLDTLDEDSRSAKSLAHYRAGDNEYIFTGGNYEKTKAGRRKDFQDSAAAPYLKEFYRIMSAKLGSYDLAFFDTVEFSKDRFFRELKTFFDSECKHLLEKSFDLHDTKKVGVLDKEDAAVFFGNVVAAELGFPKFMASWATVLALASLPRVSDRHRKTADQIIQELHIRADQAMVAYAKDTAARNEAAFRVIDVNCDGRIQKAEFIKVFTPFDHVGEAGRSERAREFRLALGFAFD